MWHCGEVSRSVFAVSLPKDAAEVLVEYAEAVEVEVEVGVGILALSVVLSAESEMWFVVAGSFCTIGGGRFRHEGVYCLKCGMNCRIGREVSVPEA